MFLASGIRASFFFTECIQKVMDVCTIIASSEQDDRNGYPNSQFIYQLDAAAACKTVS